MEGELGPKKFWKKMVEERPEFVFFVLCELAELRYWHYLSETKEK